MKFSIIIPTHDPKYLGRAVQSALDQTFQDFEIVVVPNGKANVSGIKNVDDRIRVVPFDGPPKVGAVKAFAFALGKGDYLLELDHDDLLAPNCLKELLPAFLDGKADFAYGNVAEFSDDGVPPNAWDKDWGWVERPQTILGRDVMELVAFSPDPASFSKIYFAPAHPRAWRREFYHKVGGHNPDLEVCDDHELMARSYIHGNVAHVDSCLYLYRVHAWNTIRSTQDKILCETWRIYDQFVEPMVLKWCSLKRLPAIDLLAWDKGSKPRVGWETWLNWQSAPTIGAAWADGYLHLEENPYRAMQFIHDRLTPGGWLLSKTPSSVGKAAFANPLTKSHWNDMSFRYYIDKAYGSTIGNGTVRFQSHRLVEMYPSQWHEDNKSPYVFFDGVALKDGYRGPGPVDI